MLAGLLSSVCPPPLPLFGWPAAMPRAVLPLWCGVVAYAGLAITAIIDARRGVIPDWILLLVSLIVIPVVMIGFPWPELAMRILRAVGFALVVWAVNESYYRLRGREAIGMGDAKWSAVAILAFGITPTVIAWGIGAWLGLGWMAFRRWRDKAVPGLVYFAPFLLAGLTLALLGAAALCR